METNIIVKNHGIQNKSDYESNNIFNGEEFKWIEILEEEELKKIDAYIELEQEYYLINQSYPLEEKSLSNK